MLVLTGAGVSAASGIPTYRDENGLWQSNQPIQHQEFISEHRSRQRYWTRSYIGWQAMRDAAPNQAHHALAELESMGLINLLITQNVDRLHQDSGHKKVIDLHGRIDRVLCLDCGTSLRRREMQALLEAGNSFLKTLSPAVKKAPDGDAYVQESAYTELDVPECPNCSGLLKPDVVFFGGSVPKDRVESAMQALEEAGSLLVIGSSLMVYSGFRFCKAAKALGKPIAIMTQGKTRADELADLKLHEDCTELLPDLVRSLAQDR